MVRVQTVRFIVKREFLYGERRYQPGDEFEPEGKRLDEHLIRTHCRTERIFPEVIPQEKTRGTKEQKEAKHAA